MSHPLLEAAAARAEEALSLVRELAEIESPTGDAWAMRRIFDRISPEFERRGYRVRRVPHSRSGHDGGGHLLAVPVSRPRGVRPQLVMGHLDTVWPVGTLEEMPVREEYGLLHGPGVFDMKGGVVLGLSALDVLRDAGVAPAAPVVFFINSDEETGSPDSRRHVRRLGRIMSRAYVAEPGLGIEGHLKTRRKGILRFDVIARGRSAHSGVDPERGRNAVEALARATLRLHALNDFEKGTTVNVGVFTGGTRVNVVPALARAAVDVRVRTREAAREIEEEIRAIRPEVPGTTLEVDGGLVYGPLEPTPRNRRLWETALRVADDLGMEVQEVAAGGGSDANLLSPLTATLDGVGVVGDGAHAHHEHLVVDRMPERMALLAALLAAPVEDPA